MRRSSASSARNLTRRLERAKRELTPPAQLERDNGTREVFIAQRPISRRLPSRDSNAKGYAIAIATHSYDHDGYVPALYSVHYEQITNLTYLNLHYYV